MVVIGDQAIYNVLIMTATVTPPPGAPGLTRVDPKVRLEDYRSSLVFYLGLLGKCLDAIVFAENSGADLSILRAAVAEAGHVGRVEFMVFNDMDRPPSHGRCSGEARILDYAMANSRIVAEARDNSVFWKITGRYKVRNLEAVMANRPPHFDLYCDLRHSRTPWADMRLMAWTKLGHSQMFKGIGEAIREDKNGGRPGEETLFYELQKRVVGGNSVTCLTREPLIDGVRAFDNQNWSQGRQKAVYYLRSLQRRLLQRVWI